MSDNNKTKQFIRGGQITLHNFRMFGQVMKIVCAVSLVALLSFNFVWYKYTNDRYEQYLFESYIKANAKVTIFDDKSMQLFITPEGSNYQTLSRNIIKSPAVISSVNSVINNALNGAFVSLLFYFIFSAVTVFFVRRKGKSVTDHKILNNHELVDSKIFKRIIKKQGLASKITIGTVPLIKDSESKHIFLHGSTGSGKSTCIKELMQALIKRGDKFIVYDKSCDLTNTFYDPDKHVILNPFDTRSKSWNVWVDARNSSDLDGIAEALMPMPKGSQDPFWVNAARTIFTSTAFQMRNDKDKSNLKLLRNLLTADLEKMEKFLENTEAATLVSEKIEKTAVSIKSVLATYLKSIKYLQDNNNLLSIRDWVSDPNSQGIFITSLADKHPALRPLISMWLDIAINATMSLEPNRQRRIWIILDEAHSLHRLPCLSDGVNEARKFGGCFVLGTTSYAGLCDLYGQNGARGILDQFNTSIYFRTPRSETAAWVSKELGESEIEEMQENISYGANSIRDGVSLSKHRIRRAVVPYTDIQRLNDLEAYLRTSGSFPITKIKFDIYKSAGKSEGYVAADINEDIFNDISKLEEAYIENPQEAPENRFKDVRAKVVKEKDKNIKLKKTNEQSMIEMI